MASTLLESATGLLTPDLLARASSLLGESESSVSRALTRGAIPALLAGVAATTTQERGGAERLLALLRDPGFDPRAALQSPASLLGEGGAAPGLRDLGSRLIAQVFGGRSDSLINALAEFAGIRSSSASTLLRFAAPLVLGVIGDRVRRDGLDKNSLASLLSQEQRDLALPPLLRNAIGLPGAAAAGVQAARVGAPRWIWPALALLAVAFLWMLMRNRETVPPRGVTELPPVAAARPTSDWVTRRLPSGTELRVPATGIEARLVGHLDGSSPRDEWFDFDRLLFETGSATLKPESQEQLSNVAAILKAYPSARIKIGGYTDNQGDPAANLDLSQQRAANVRDSLVALGVAADRLEAEGYGDRHPVASNATEEGRARNRRIAIHVES
jgi:outer membrane protein OmpA-like peptidoglycan-associated protein